MVGGLRVIKADNKGSISDHGNGLREGEERRVLLGVNERGPCKKSPRSGSGANTAMGDTLVARND